MGEAGGAAAAQLALLQQEAGYRVRDHFSGALAFAPIPSSSRSVVARSAAMPFWSCAIDLTPFADLGSLSMFRSFLFRRQSEIAFRSMVPHIEFGAMSRYTTFRGAPIKLSVMKLFRCRKRHPAASRYRRRRGPSPAPWTARRRPIGAWRRSLRQPSRSRRWSNVRRHERSDEANRSRARSNGHAVR